MSDDEVDPLKMLAATPGPGAWVQDAACAGMPPELFDTPPIGAHPRQEIKRQTEAARVCQGCPVRRQCRDYQLETKAVGIWGGFLNTGSGGLGAGVDLIQNRLINGMAANVALKHRLRTYRSPSNPAA